ncbi:MAG TPA: ABC transporter permease, partial [Candidatus Kapabacteria bacterium]|nr:ABC transporter permease [Candidatus Kapabacteria bacterium]
MIVAIATAGVAVGVAALIVTLSILAGFEKTLTDNVVRYTAHARVAVYGGRPIPDYKSTVAHLERKVPEITQVMPFVQREAVLRSPTTVAGVLLRGIVGEDTAIINKNTIIAGTDLLSAKADTLPPIILSEGTARELNTTVGKALTAIRFFENIQSREQLLDNISRFRVVGIFRTGMTEYDNMQAFTTLEAAQEFVGFSAKQASGFNIMTHSLAEVPELTRNVQHTLKYPFYVESVFDIGQTIFAWIQLQKQPIPIILGLII